ncbi:MAG TPA: PH domain-containing protein [Mycobacteriales bacterium]|jgi:uncharacterized membrane protein YdbT with pleckstrin-like domain|nr:PH domain-containing protein [Mycobacteriales bacterium]
MAPYSSQRYLLPTERGVIEVRRHWAILIKPVGLALVVMAAAFAISFALKFESTAQTVAWWLAILAFLRLAYVVADWYAERLVITNKRFLLTTGLLTRKVAIMPLTKVTDMTYQRSVFGQILGYGVFIVESAGQDQALSRITFLPHPDDLYQQISTLLFGSPDDGGD